LLIGLASFHRELADVDEDKQVQAAGIGWTMASENN